MPRQPRTYLAGVPAHVVHRGNNRNACFFTGNDFRFYQACLGDACGRYQVALHAYVLMTNHVHLLMTPRENDGISRVMQSLGRRYVQYINRTYRHTGTLWESRHKASLVDAERYLLVCYRYIELNPARAGMASHPADYPWSSFRAHARDEYDALVFDHQSFRGLGANVAERQRAYLELFRHPLKTNQLLEIRTAVNYSVPLGDEHFRTRIERVLGRRVGRGRRGQPSGSDRP